MLASEHFSRNIHHLFVYIFLSDIQNPFLETIAEFMEDGLDAELDDELDYSKYGHKNKDTEEIIQLMTVFSNFCI